MSRLARLLAQPGVFVEREGEDYVVRNHPDRRRKPLARLGAADYVAATRRLEAETRDVVPQWQTDDEGLNVRRSVNRAESPMAWLMRHKDENGLSFLDKRHLAALEALRDDHLTAHAQPGLTSNWQAFGAGGGRGWRGGEDPHVFRLHAKRRCEAALACLGALRGLFERVCLDGTSLCVAERGFSLPRHTAKHRVREALDQLAVHYGY